MKLSIIIPCKNEEGNIEELHNKISKTLKKIKYETIYIDDGSTDNTLNKLKELYKKDNKKVKVLSFSRNFKKEAAMLAGLQYATGEYTCIIDADLQQNPKYLLQMYNHLENKLIENKLQNTKEDIANYIKETYHFTVKVTPNAPNVDSNVYRNLIRLTGVLDTKYGNNNLVIYPTLR